MESELISVRKQIEGIVDSVQPVVRPSNGKGEINCAEGF